MADVTYTAQVRGATHGAITGHYRVLRPGRRVTAPEGEFDHLPEGAVRLDEQVETTSAVPERETAARVGLTKKHTGAGWYEIRRGAEVVDKVRGEDAADAYIEEHG